MTEELKPCPFCGGPAEIDSIEFRHPDEYGNDITFSVSCQDKGCIGWFTGCEGYGTRDAAVRAWNKRPGCEGCRRKNEPNRAYICRYCSRMWLYKDMYEPNDNDEKED